MYFFSKFQLIITFESMASNTFAMETGQNSLICICVQITAQKTKYYLQCNPRNGNT